MQTMRSHPEGSPPSPAKQRSQSSLFKATLSRAGPPPPMQGIASPEPGDPDASGGGLPKADAEVEGARSKPAGGQTK
eukprot:5813598-Pyramimonas_sp.AAC.1